MELNKPRQLEQMYEELNPRFNNKIQKDEYEQNFISSSKTSNPKSDMKDNEEDIEYKERFTSSHPDKLKNVEDVDRNHRVRMSNDYETNFKTSCNPPTVKGEIKCSVTDQTCGEHQI